MASKRSVLKRHRLAIIVVAVLIALVCTLLVARVLRLRSIDRQLDAIEAAEAIPDSENAAVAYFAFVREYAPPPAVPHPKTNSVIWTQPWTSDEYPEVAAILTAHQGGIERLFEIANIEKCRFPIPRDHPEAFGPNHPIVLMRRWVQLLICGANQDLGEGRVQEAVEKCDCLLRIAGHFHRQPALVYHNVGLAFEGVPSWTLKHMIVTGNITNEQLLRLRDAMPPTQDTWKQDRRKLAEVESLLKRKRQRLFGPRSQIRQLLLRSSEPDVLDRTEKVYYRSLADRRGKYILIALRQYKNETGHWPESLDAIRESLGDEILADPRNGISFLYELKDDGSGLMSFIPKNPGEGSNYRTPDHWAIWPTQ